MGEAEDIFPVSTALYLCVCRMRNGLTAGFDIWFLFYGLLYYVSTFERDLFDFLACFQCADTLPMDNNAAHYLQSLWQQQQANGPTNIYIAWNENLLWIHLILITHSVLGCINMYYYYFVCNFSCCWCFSRRPSSWYHLSRSEISQETKSVSVKHYIGYSENEDNIW